MNEREKISALMCERQHITHPANESEYTALFRDLQPGLNIYWNGFGQPPTLSYRAAFDDIAFNRRRQSERKLIKGRFVGGNVGWIEPGELELFAAVYRKPLDKPTAIQSTLLELIDSSGPLTIQQIKEETGLLVKQITPALHRLQEAFLVYEDQYDGEWDRGWYRFSEIFSEARLDRFERMEAIKELLLRFAYRIVCFDFAMAKSCFRIPECEIKAAVAELCLEERLIAFAGGFIRAEDADELNRPREPIRCVLALHRNDFLYRANEARLKALAAQLTQGLDYDCEPLQYLFIDGEFHGASVGHFRNGPYDLNDIVCDLPDAASRRDEIIAAVRAVNFGKMPSRFMGKPI